MKRKYKCSCNKCAIYYYMPSSDNKLEQRYFCDDCVPRGCTCNYHHLDNDFEEKPTEEDKPYKWIEENKIWCHVDEKGREYPCCEYDYDEEGFDKQTLLEKICTKYAYTDSTQYIIFNFLVLCLSKDGGYIRIINKSCGIEWDKKLKFSQRIKKNKYLKIGKYYFSIIKK